MGLNYFKKKTHGSGTIVYINKDGDNRCKYCDNVCDPMCLSSDII